MRLRYRKQNVRNNFKRSSKSESRMQSWLIKDKCKNKLSNRKFRRQKRLERGRDFKNIKMSSRNYNNWSRLESRHFWIDKKCKS
jgi:hypothetical protein